MKHPDDAPAEKLDDLVVVVACEDATTAPRVWSMLQRVGREAGGRGRLIYSWWTFAVLASPSLRHLAAREAAGADMVMVAGRGESPLPVAVREWLSTWVACSGDPLRPRALVALTEAAPTHGGRSRGLVSELKGLAECGAVDFFAEGFEARETVVAPLRVGPPSGNVGCHSLRGGARMVAPGSQARLAAEETPR